MKVLKTILLSVVIPIVLIWIGHLIDTKDREPTFHVEEDKTIILEQSNFSVAPIQVLRTDGKPIRKDVISTRFYFFNQGRLTIKPENIYAPIEIKLSDSTNHIIELKVLRTSRDVSGIDVTLDSVKNIIKVNFTALEQNDGFAAQIIYDGDVGTNLEIYGGVEGVTSFKDKLDYSLWNIYTLGAVIMGIFGLMFSGLTSIDPRDDDRKPAWIPIIVTAIILAVVGYFILYPNENRNFKVPESIRLE